MNKQTDKIQVLCIDNTLPNLNWIQSLAEALNSSSSLFISFFLIPVINKKKRNLLEAKTNASIRRGMTSALPKCAS